ncbi:MAG: hypothetical protein QXR89_07030 [Candidatus Bathyarchaeia archaeon]
MKTCKVCGKKIPDRLTYCSDECAEKDKATSTTEKSNPPFLTQFDRGHGSVRREANIRKVAEMLENGISEDDIRFQLSILFRPMTVDDYIRTAKELLKRKNR